MANFSNNNQNAFARFGQAKEDKDTSRTKFSFTKKDLESKDYYQPIPEGQYSFTVYDCKTDYTKKDNTPMKVVTMEIDYEGKKIRVNDYLIMKDNQMWKVGRFFASIGLWDELEQNGLEGVVDPIWDTAIGRTGEFKTKHHEYNGRTSNEVAGYIVPGTLAVR